MEGLDAVETKCLIDKFEFEFEFEFVKGKKDTVLFI